MAKKSSHRKEEERAAHETKHQTASGVKDALSATKAFYVANEKRILLGLTILLILIPLLLAFQFRSYSDDLAVADNWATTSVHSAVRNSLTQQIAQQYPNLPQANRDQLVEEQFQKVLVEQGDQIDQQIELTAAGFRAQMKDADGQTYLIAIDPYHFLRQVENIVDHGHVGDELRNSIPYDTHILAPIGTPVNSRFHTDMGAFFYRFVSFFKQTTPMAVMFWVPVIFSMLAVIPVFFIARRRAGLLAAFFAAIIIAVHAGFVGRTAAGFSDTDAYVILFPLLCGWLLLEAFECKWAEWKRELLFLCATGFSFGLFAIAWEWWFFFDIFLLTLLAHFGFILLRHLFSERNLRGFFSSLPLKNWLRTFFGFIMAVGIFVTLFTNFSTFVRAPFTAVQTTEGIKAAVNLGSLWPNVQTTVAELNVPSIAGIISSIGGKFLFVLALMGVLATMTSKKRLLPKDWLLLSLGLAIFLFLVGKGATLTIIQFLLIMILPVGLGLIFLLKDDRDIDVKYALFLIIWLAASVFAMTKGVRFVLLLIPPFAIGAGVAVGFIFSLLKEWLTKEVKFSVFWVAPLLFVLLSLLLLQPIQAGKATGMSEAPSMSDAWWNALTKIKQESAPDAIINSWWDFGHWFKYVADRGVTFDGGSQNVPHAHWIGRALITDDEKEAIAILRMVTCGSYLGTIDIKEGLPSHDDYESIMLTKEIIMLPQEAARERLLEAGISSEMTEQVLNHTHCAPPEDYFITSADMIGKGGVWGHFGSWDFARADAYQNLRDLSQVEATAIMEEKYGWTEEAAKQRYYELQLLTDQNAINSWISPWPGYPMSSWQGCQLQQNGSLLACPLGLNLGTQQGTRTVLEGVLVDLEQENKTRLSVGFYNAQNQKVGQNDDILPAEIVLVRGDTFEQVSFTGESVLGQSFLVDLDNNRLLVMDPANVEGLFTKLFFLDGRGTTAFEKFTEETAFNMGKIIVWKVDWSKLETLGLE